MIQLDHGYRKRFTTELAGIATAADATPTAILYRNGSASGATVTVSTTAETGVYLATFTTDAGWAKTDHLELLVLATIDGDAGYKAVVWDSDTDPDAIMRGTDGASTHSAADVWSVSTRTLSSFGTLVSDIATAVWQAGTRTLTAISDSAGVTSLLSRITALVETKAQADARQTALLAAIDAVEGGGGASVNVLPAVGIVANRTPGVTLSPVVGETISQSITLYQTDGTTPISLSGKTLVIVFETLQGVDVATVANSSITVSGDDNNVVTFAYPSAVTAVERTLRFALRDAGAPLTMYLQGICTVTQAPQVD